MEKNRIEDLMPNPTSSFLIKLAGNATIKKPGAWYKIVIEFGKKILVDRIKYLNKYRIKNIQFQNFEYHFTM